MLISGCEKKHKMNNRIYWLDICRSIAIASVVLCHVVENVYPLTLDYMEKIDIYTKLFIFSMFTVGRLGVPLFLFITGYLLLKGEMQYGSEECLYFWKNKLVTLLGTTEIWIVIYNIFLWWCKGE